ncbi:MAG TPA: Xaa-Pro peptidase family protein [Anaerolineales bacterium]|nr:Xaa-Pro peptidase family protein [Anaerolineales bacterium]
MTSIYSDRIARLTEALPEHALDAVVLLPGPNLIYYTGLSFHLMGRPTLAVLSRGQAPTLLVPELERSKAEAHPLGGRVFSYGEDPASRLAAFGELASHLTLAKLRLGVEPLRMRWMEQQLLLEAAPGVRLGSAEAVLEPLRAVKSPAELASIERAMAVAEAALGATLPSIRAGLTEREAASELTLQLLKAGSEPELPFNPIVASGPNAALPHAVPTDRRLRVGDLLIVDWGATVDGYISDLTRTFALGNVEPEWHKVHATLAEANAAGRMAVRPGAACREVDHAARSVVEAAGYGPKFLHRTGHGIGLEAHEPPYIRADNEALLAPGMTFTVEPGIYLEGRGGIRIEDNVVVTADGGRTLSHLDRDLIVLA